MLSRRSNPLKWFGTGKVPLRLKHAARRASLHPIAHNQRKTARAEGPGVGLAADPKPKQLALGQRLRA